MDTGNYRCSAAMAIAAHVLAAAGIGAWSLLSLPTRLSREALPAVTLRLAPPAPERPPAREEPLPATLALPRPPDQPVARATPETPPLPAPPQPPAAETAVAPVRAPHAALLPPPADAAHGKTLFLADLSTGPAGVAEARPAEANGPDRLDARPVPHTAIRPLYPIGARRRGEAGQVVLEARIGADGRVLHTAVSDTSGFAELDRAAERALTRALFRPAIRDGRSVEARVRITILFRLTD